MKIAMVNPIPVNKAPATMKVRSRPARAESVFTTECLAQRTCDRVRPRGGHVALLVESDGYLVHPFACDLESARRSSGNAVR